MVAFRCCKLLTEPVWQPEGESKDRGRESEDRMQKAKVEVLLIDYGRARPSSCRERAGEAPAAAAILRGHYKMMSAEKMNKKMTNEANMLLKTKNRVYKRTQTKPTESMRKQPAAAAVEGEHCLPERRGSAHRAPPQQSAPC